MYKYRRVIISVIALLLAAAILTGLLVTVFAANSADIRTEISGLESKQDELDQKKQELEAQIAANNTQTLNVVEQKAQIDQEIELTRQEVENLNEQIRQYNLLIAEKQAELDQLQTDQNDLLDRIAADPLFPLSREELEEMLDPRAFIGCCPSQVTRFLKDTVQPVVARWGAKETLTAKLEV